MAKTDSDHQAFKLRLCKYCKWYSDRYTSVCVNDASDHLADFVEQDGSCPEWEEKKDDRQGESDQWT